MTETTVATHHDVQERFTSALRVFVGQGRAYSVASIAEASGIPHRTMKAYHQGQATPGLQNLLSLVAVLPPAFANALLEYAGLTGAHRVDGPNLTPHKVLAQMCDEAAQLAHELSDGELNHIERAELRRRLPDLIAKLATFNAQLQERAVRGRPPSA